MALSSVQTPRKGLAGAVDGQALGTGVALQVQVEDAADVRLLIEMRAVGHHVASAVSRMKRVGCGKISIRSPWLIVLLGVCPGASIRPLPPPSTAVWGSSTWFDQSSVSILAKAQ